MIEPDSPKALVLLNMGGPGSTDEVKSYLFKLFSDKDLIQILPGGFGQRIFARVISHFRAPASAEKYRRIGGRSPLREWTEKQARAISEELAASFTPFVIMRYSAPFASETLLQIRKAGIDQAVVLPMYPQYSKTTTGSSIKDFCRAATALHPRLQLYRYRSLVSLVRLPGCSGRNGSRGVGVHPRGFSFHGPDPLFRPFPAATLHRSGRSVPHPDPEDRAWCAPENR